MPEKGQKTKLLYFWLSREDVAEFSDALHEALPDMRWRCSHTGADRLLIHHFDTLQAALDCEASAIVSQAFAPLGRSELQFLRSYRMHMTDMKDATGHAYDPEIDAVNYGRMAIRWNTLDGDDAPLTALLNTIWKTFKQVTLPAKVHTTAGHPIQGFRIGKQMHETARSERLYLKANGPFCLLD